MHSLTGMTTSRTRVLLNKPFVNSEVQDGKLVYNFDKNQHARVLLHNILVMQDNDEGSLSDVIMISKDNKQFHFHGPILASLSKKIEEILLEQGLGSATSKKSKIVRIKEKFSPEAVQCLWDYAYTAIVALTPSNIEEVKEIAEHYGLDDLQKECEALDQNFQAAALIFRYLPERMLNRLHDFLLHGKLCSMMFISRFESLVKIPFHSPVIAAICTEFGLELIYGDGKNKLELDDKTFQAMAPFLQYLYTAKLMVDQETVLPLLEFSVDFNIPSIGHACCSWLKFTSTADHALGIMGIAQAWKVKVKEANGPETNSKAGVNISDALDDLYHYARSLVLRNFSSVKESNDYLVISFEEFIDLIVDDDLVVNSEEDVFYAVMKWIEFSPERRAEDLPNLLQSVRLEHLSIAFLDTIIEHELIITNSGCIELIDIAQGHCVQITSARSRRSRCSSGMACKPGMKVHEFHVCLLYVTLA